MSRALSRQVTGSGRPQAYTNRSYGGGAPLRQHPSAASAHHVDSPVVWEEDHHPVDEEDETEIATTPDYQHTAGGLRSRSSHTAVDGSTKPDDLEKGSVKPAGTPTGPGDPPGRTLSKVPTSQIPPEERKWKDDLVTFDTRDDPANPKNWTTRRKFAVTALLGLLTMSASLATSIFSPGTKYISREYGVSTEVTTLGTSLFLLGYVPGPVIWGPLSELYGRKWPVIIPMFIFACFSVATATAENFQTIMICRFFAGVFACAPVTNVGGGIADMFDQRDRATAVVLYSIAVVGGPTIGPIIGAAVSQTPSLGWRWTEYLVTIYTVVVVVMGVVLVPETFAPRILQKKAHDLRFRTGRWALHSRLDMEDTSIIYFLEKNLTRPIKMLLTEPIMLCVTTYNAFTYGVLYLLFGAVPIVYEEGRGWNTLVGSLPFIATLLGCLTGASINLAYGTQYYIKKVDAANGPVPPELRLPPMALGSLCFPIGFFLLGWTANPGIQWFPSVLGLYFIGTAFLLIFQAGINYLLDVYGHYAASAIGANTFMRSLFAAALPLVAQPLFHNLGDAWACSLLGFLAILLAGVPFLFMIYGPALRARSKMVQSLNA